MAGFLSSVNLIAGAGILGNVGGVPITANATTLASIATFLALPVETQFANVKTTGSSVLTAGTMTSLQNLAGNTFPVVTNAVPSSYISSLGNTPQSGFTSTVTSQMNTILGNGDLGKFEQILGAAEGLVVSTNQLINSMINANNTSSNATYSTQDNTITGGLSQITQAFEAFGADLTALGVSIDLNDLPNIGSPQALLKQVYSQTGGVPELTNALVNAGISQTILTDIDNIVMTDEQQRIAFDVMSTITGSTLTQVLKLLKVTTSGLANMSELLNPVKTFPLSFDTLTAPTANGLRGIYINSSGLVNTNLETELPASVLAPLQGYQTVRNTYTQLRKIIPPDWALANKALQAGLQQVKSIFNSNLPSVALASIKLESNKGLNLINNLTGPLPTAVTDFFKQSYTTGTGTNGTLLLVDVIGSAAGWVVNGNVTAATAGISTLSSSGALNTLTNGTNGVFTIMQNTIDGDYTVVIPNPPDGPDTIIITIPPGLPGAGVYSSYDDAFNTGLIPAAYSLIANIVSSNSAAVSSLNSDWTNIASQLVTELTNLSKAGVVFSDLVPGIPPNGLVGSIAQYGLDTTLGGAAWFFESISNTSTQGGQAIISTMREARNQVRLQEAGVETDIIVSDTVAQPQATLSSGQYTASEAASQKII